MIKRLPSRNQRSKGVKVKHVLQIFLLLGVCFWLIYQIKHSHDKKKEFAENDAKKSVKMQTVDEILKLGRKDLHPGKDEINKNEKHEEEEEDVTAEEDEKNKHEHEEQEEEEENNHEVGEQGDEENKHKIEEQEEDENGSEEIEDEGRDGEDDEIDDQEKSEGLTDRDEKFMEEEKEKEEEGDEKENENSEDEEKEAHNENQNTHEAREEHYKGDDASSAVAHDTQTSSTDTETVSSDNSDAKSDVSITEQDNKLNYNEESNKNHNDSDLRVTEGQFTKGTLNTTAGEESENRNLSNPSDSSNLNTTVTTNSDRHLEAGSNLTVITDVTYNSTQTGAVTSGSSENNGMVILSESDHAQNATVDAKVTEDVKNVQTEGSEQTSNKVTEEKVSDTNSSVSVGTENVDAAAGEASNWGAGELEKTIKSVATNETENNSRDSDVKEKTDATQDKEPKVSTETDDTTETENKSRDSDIKENSDASEEDKSKDDTQTGGTDGTTNSSSENETSDAIEHDAIDSSDSHFHNDVTEVRTDLDTLPDSRTEGDNGNDIAAE